MFQKFIVFTTPPQKLAITLFAVLLVAVLSGAIELTLWSQVTIPWWEYFLQFGWVEYEPPINPVEYKVLGYPFLLRQTVTYPFFVGGIVLNTDPNFLYSILLPFLAAIVVLSISKVVETLSFQQPTHLTIPLLIPISSLFFLMSGRLPLAFAGFSLALYSQLCINDKPMSLRVFLTCISILLSSVATGTMLATFILVIVLNCYRFLKTKNPAELVPTIITILLFGLPIVWGIDKVFRYYIRVNGSMWHVVEHGFAKQMIDLLLTPIGIAVFVLLLCGGYFSIRIILRYVPVELVLTIACTFALGAFGYSTLSLISIPLTAVAMTFVLMQFSKPPISIQPQPYSY